MAKTLQHLCDFVFLTVANISLALRGTYLDHLKSGIKRDTPTSLRNVPLHLATLSDSALKKAKDEKYQ